MSTSRSRSATKPRKSRDGAGDSATAAAAAHAQSHDKLLATLFFELFQTEQSAIAHPSREADRYRDTPPAMALLAIADHAKSMLPDIEQLAQERDIKLTRTGKVVGEMFSVIRDAVVDRLVSSEKSYRGTLIGVRHGVDLVHLIAAVAEESNDRDLVRFTTGWMRDREPLVERAAAALSWFARHPEVAVRAYGKTRSSPRRASTASDAPRRVPRPASAT